MIANTIAITVAQRMRELATLRTLGASRRQVLRSVVLESVVIGLAAPSSGSSSGSAIAVGLNALLDAIGIDLPSSGLVFSARTIVVSLVVGTLIAFSQASGRRSGRRASSRSRLSARAPSCRRPAPPAIRARVQ